MDERNRLISLEDAFERLDAALDNRKLPARTVSVPEAIGHILAADVASRLDLPPFDKSAVDGYAIRAGDERSEYQWLETIAAGHPGGAVLQPGTTAKVMTGAPIPDGTAKVVMLEHTSELDGVVRVRKHSPEANICWRAEDIKAGETVLTKGQRVGALEVANLIACGVTEVAVVVPPSVFVISTGDEVVDRVDQLGPGLIMNSNGPLLAGLAREHGLLVKGQAWVKDDSRELETVLRQALNEADIVALSGGVSMGDYDYVPEVIERLGLTVSFDRLAVKPGKPTTFAGDGEKLLFGLPGNPAAVYLMFHLLVLRVAARLTGAAPPTRQFRARMGHSFERRSTARAEYVPARITSNGDVQKIEYHGTAHLTAFMQADGWFVVPVGVAKLPAGDQVTFVALGMRPQI